MVVAVVIFAAMTLVIGVPMVIAAWVMRSVYTLFTACLIVLGFGIAIFLLAGVLEVASDELPVGWAVAVALIAAAVLTSRARTRFLHAGLGYTAIKLGLPTPRHAPRVEGFVGETAVVVDFDTVVTRSSKGATSETRYTIIEAKGPKVPLFIELRRQGVVGSLLTRAGYAIDIQTGNARFDRAYIVEGAPAEIVKALLTPEIVAAILRQKPSVLHVGDGQVRFQFQGWRLLHRQVDDFVAIASHLAGSAEQLFEASERDLIVAEGAPFRGTFDATAAAAASRARAEEIESYYAVRARRERLFFALGCGFAGLLAVLFGYIYWATH